MEAATTARELDISDDRVEMPELNPRDLPRCPECGDGLLRPGVVWFNEILPAQMMKDIDQWISDSESIDIMLVIGTSSRVYPAAGYVDEARAKGARVAVINMDRADAPGGLYGLDEGDWFFEGDAGVILPEILKGEIGDISDMVRDGQ
jgi:NAD-dependent SIR2 family protein deacetylase